MAFQQETFRRLCLAHVLQYCFQDHFNAHNSFCFHQPVYALATTLPAARRRMYQVAVDQLAATVADAEVAPEEVVPRAPALRCQSAGT